MSCESCASNAKERTKLLAENDELKAQLHELNKLCALQAADLERYRIACLKQRPNEPEHAPREQLQSNPSTNDVGRPVTADGPQ